MNMETAVSQRRCHHGGREVLGIATERIGGDTPLAIHVSALCDALEAYALRALQPRAAAELERLVAKGRGYTFLPHRYTVRLKLARRRGRLSVTLSATHAQGERVHTHRALCMRWSADGAVQYRIRREKKE